MYLKQPDILLIRPNSKITVQIPPREVGYLPSSLIKNRISVDIKNCLSDNISVEKTAAFIREKL